MVPTIAENGDTPAFTLLGILILLLGLCVCPCVCVFF